MLFLTSLLPMYVFSVGTVPKASPELVSTTLSVGPPLKYSLCQDGRAIYWLENHGDALSPWVKGSARERLFVRELQQDGLVRTLRLSSNISHEICQDEEPYRIAMQATSSGLTIACGNRLTVINKDLTTIQEFSIDVNDFSEMPCAELLSASGRTLWVIGPSKRRYVDFRNRARNYLSRRRAASMEPFPSAEDFICITYDISSGMHLISKKPIRFIPRYLNPVLFSIGEAGYFVDSSRVVQLSNNGDIREFARWMPLRDFYPTSAVFSTVQSKQILLTDRAHIFATKIRDDSNVAYLHEVESERSTAELSLENGEPVAIDVEGYSNSLTGAHNSSIKIVPDIVEPSVMSGSACDRKGVFAVFTTKRVYLTDYAHAFH